MIKERAKELSDILLAYSQGKLIQISNNGNQWVEWIATNPDSIFNYNYYRIKPKPKLVPFTFEDELLGRKIIYSDGTRAMITAQKKDGVYIGGSLNLTSYSSLISTTKFEDGSPCGKYINE